MRIALEPQGSWPHAIKTGPACQKKGTPEGRRFSLQTCDGSPQVSWIQFDAEAVSARSPGGYRDCAGAKKRVQNNVTDKREHLNQTRCQFFGIGRRMGLCGSP